MVVAGTSVAAVRLHRCRLRVGLVVAEAVAADVPASVVVEAAVAVRAAEAVEVAEAVAVVAVTAVAVDKSLF